MLNTQKKLVAVFLAAVLLTLYGCGEEEQATTRMMKGHSGMGGMMNSQDNGTTSSLKTVAGRWYTKAQVEQGAPLFASYCAACHGKEAQGDFRWRQRGADGRFPPPPLNGSGHAWHHPKPMITRQIRKGSPPGGSMPGFGAQLSDAQIKAVIAWFQNFWSAEIYQSWQRGMRHKG